MKTRDSLARGSQYIAAAALVLVVAMLALNTASWFSPHWAGWTAVRG